MEMQNEMAMTFKVVLLGESNVGKTSILHRFTNDTFLETTEPTIGLAFSKKIIERKNIRITLEIWDTAGQEKFKKIAPIYYRNAQAVLICFDVTKAETFEAAKKWLEEVDRFLSIDCARFLVGNKIDLGNYAIEKEKIDQFIHQSQMAYIETSAKSGNNIHRLFRRVARALAKNKLKKMDLLDQKTGIIQLTVQNEEDQKNQNKRIYCCNQ